MITFSPRAIGLTVASIAPALLVAAFGRQIVAAGGPNALLGLAGLAVLWTLGLVLVYWRGIDEAARDAQKSAWLWGGVAGVLVGLAALAAPTPLQSLVGGVIAAAAAPLLREGEPSTDVMFALGMLYILVWQMIGFFIFWIGWWIVKR